MRWRWIVLAAGLAALAGCSASTSSPSPNGPDREIAVKVEGDLVTGPGRVEVAQGTEVTVVVEADVSDEVHVHGYDLHGDVTPGDPARITFEATAPGVFEVELEGAGLLLFRLEVTP